jgi:nitroreductase
MLMELYDIMRSTFSAREFTDDPIPDRTIFKILDNARFAPSGGNRQGWRVIIIRRQESREALVELTIPAAKRYAAQIRAGENPWNTVNLTKVDGRTIELTAAPSQFTKPYLQAAVVLVVCVDLRVVASMDQYLNRVGVVSGASIYPFVWNILLAARHEGYGGTITTIAISEEPKLQELLGIPEHFAVSAIIPLGKPVKRLTKLTRKPVASFTMFERWDGEPLAEVRDE